MSDSFSQHHSWQKPNPSTYECMRPANFFIVAFASSLFNFSKKLWRPSVAFIVWGVWVSYLLSFFVMSRFRAIFSFVGCSFIKWWVVVGSVSYIQTYQFSLSRLVIFFIHPHPKWGRCGLYHVQQPPVGYNMCSTNHRLDMSHHNCHSYNFCQMHLQWKTMASQPWLRDFTLDNF